MAFDFPNTPTIGQIYQGYIWDGLAWQVQPAAAQGVVRYDVVQGLTSPHQSHAISNLGLPFNCGRLHLVNTTTLSFLPFNGDLIKINGLVYRIPSGGIAGLANTNVFIDADTWSEPEPCRVKTLLRLCIYQRWCRHRQLFGYWARHQFDRRKRRHRSQERRQQQNIARDAVHQRISAILGHIDRVLVQSSF